MCLKWWLFLLCCGFLHFCAINCQSTANNFLDPDQDQFPNDPDENMTTSANWTTTTMSPLEESTTPLSETTTPSVNVAPVQCRTNKDCEKLENDDPTYIIICETSVGLCVVGKIEPPNWETVPPTTLRPKRTTEGNVQPPAQPSSTAAPNTGGGEQKNQSDFSNVPPIVWVLMVVPFVSIIVLGVICGRRLKAQSLNIQENLMRTTINGVHVDQLLSQRELLNSLAFSRPPPTYEKATGEIPPSYETFLQALQEKRQSIFNCDSLMTEPDKEGDSVSVSYSSSGGSLRSLPPINHHRTGRGSPLIFAISHTNVP